MKILCLSDLHMHSKKSCREKKRWIESLIEEDRPDVIVISGDVFESGFANRYDVYEVLNRFTDGEIPIIATLGNHEFVDQTVDQTLSYYKDNYNPKKYNVHYLDIIGHYDIGEVRFFGNILWYDGSLKCYENQDLYDWGNGCWLDKRIVNFDWLKENKKCIQQIDDNYDEEKINILVTHCVPHIDINGHPRNSELNAFSGVKNILKNYILDYSISGHTHSKVLGIEREGCYCINIGNDYYQPFHHYMLEI